MEQLPIVFFDSGLGGISILRCCVRQMPEENYVYYGDSLHAPYGTKTAAEVERLCFEALDPFVRQGAKALVIACNTATSAAIAALRRAYPSLPIIGTEPALKPAVERYPHGRIAVMATPMTLREEKFLRLQAQYGADAEILSVPCAGLMEFVERGILDGAEVEAYLEEKLKNCRDCDAIVLGCTHYPFLIGSIRRVIGEAPEIIDSSEGVTQQLYRRLAEGDLLHGGSGSVVFCSSLPQTEVLAERLFAEKY